MDDQDRVVSAELLEGGLLLLIGFADDRQAKYSGALLRSVFDLAEEVIPEQPGD